MKVFKAARPQGMAQEEFEDALSRLRAAPYSTTLLVKYPSGEYCISVGTYCYKSLGMNEGCEIEAVSFSVYRNYAEIQEDDIWGFDTEDRSPFGDSTLPVRYNNEVNV